MMGHVKVTITATGHALPGGGVTRSAIILFTNPRTSSSVIVLDGLGESWDTGSCPALPGHAGKTVLLTHLRLRRTKCSGSVAGMMTERMHEVMNEWVGKLC